MVCPRLGSKDIGSSDQDGKTFFGARRSVVGVCIYEIVYRSRPAPRVQFFLCLQRLTGDQLLKGGHRATGRLTRPERATSKKTTPRKNVQRGSIIP